MELLAALLLLAGGVAIWRYSTSPVSLPAPSRIAEVLERNVALHGALPGHLRERHVAAVRRFLEAVDVEGCGGLEADDEVRVTIAGHAALLLLGERWERFPELSVVLVYPGAFVVPAGAEVSTDPFGAGSVGGVVDVLEDDVRLGESTELGSIVLAWDAVRRDFGSGPVPRDMPENVALHEFAHRLDPVDYPVIGDAIDDLDAWLETLDEAYADVVRRVDLGKATFLDAYASEDPAEFFAVATEAFFERPRDLKVRYGRLYAALSEHYALDPASWDAAG